MNQEHIDKAVARSMKVILHVAQATFGTEERWQFFRSVLLDSLNDLKRELSGQTTERKGTDHGTRNSQER